MFYVSDFKTTSKIERFGESVQENSHEKTEKKESSWKDYFNMLLDEYCRCGSLHGLRYIRDPSIPRAERLLWLSILMTCLFSSWVVVWEAYKQGATHSFTLDINPQLTPIWEIPYPAVLVCSPYPIRKSFFDLDKEVGNMKYRQFSRMVCPNKMAFGSEVYNESIDKGFFQFILEAAIPCKDLIVNCSWQGKKKDCCSYFRPLLTAFGLCYIFNSLPGEIKYRKFSPIPGTQTNYDGDMLFWNLEDGYPRREGKKAKLVRPLWSENGGYDGGLTFDLIDNRDEWQENCSGSVHGFQLAVFPPNENYETEAITRIPHNEHSYIKLHPNLVLAERSLRSIEIKERECVFNNEAKLDYFTQYTQASCRMECYIEKTLRNCGCTIFSAQRFLGNNNDYSYCNDTRYNCLGNQISNLITNPLTKPNAKVSDYKCMCVPSCSWLTYDYQTSFEPIITPTTLPPWADGYNQSLEENFARVSIYFSLQQFNTIDRRRTSTLGNFLGNCGGLLGLFLGFSVMSLFEVIYFVLIRPFNRVITLYTTRKRED